MMVIVLRLINGDTVLGLLAIEDEDGVSIQDPFTLEYRVDMKGYRSMVLHRYNPFAIESIVSFRQSSIVSIYTADDDLSDYYYFTLDHAVKFRDQAMSLDIQRASEYIQGLIDNNNKSQTQYDTEKDTVPVNLHKSGNTVH